MIDKAAVKQELLYDGHDDWTGLWEVVWYIQTEAPELRGDPARELARDLIGELLADGTIYLCEFDDDTNTEHPIPVAKARELIKKDQSWEPPDSELGQLRYVTTEKGMKSLFKTNEAQP